MPAHETLALIASTSSQGSYEPVHSCSLAKAFSACMHNIEVISHVLLTLAFFEKGHPWNNSVNLNKIGPVVLEELSFKASTCSC